MASTTAVICAAVSALRTMAPVFAAVPVAVTGLSMMKALPLPVMLFSAVAPPPPMARLDCVLAATWIAVARDVALMVAASLELTSTLPLVAVTWLTFWRYACMLSSMSLREALRPTDTAVVCDVPPPTAREVASICDVIVEVSWACAITLPLPACTSVDPLTEDSTWVLILFRATTAPTLMALVSLFEEVEILIAVALFLRSALMFAFEVAMIMTAPAAWADVFSSEATTSAGCSPPRLVLNRASRVLKRKFCDSMPMVLNASVTPTEVPFEIVVLSMVAWTDMVFVAVTSMLPLVVVVRLLFLA